MKKFTSSFLFPLSIVLLVLIFDQSVKIWVKTNMELREEFTVFKDWFIIHFIENKGMAFGIEFGFLGQYGKLFLSVFRMVAVAIIGVYLFKLPKRDVSKGFIISGSLIFAGALGNIIDSAFYGLIFNHSHGQVATMFPEGGGYAGFLYGSVVDMLYFPLIDGYFPEWVPKWGGQHFIFFRPVFNIADSAITIGVISILLFQRKFFKQDLIARAEDELVNKEEEKSED